MTYVFVRPGDHVGEAIRQAFEKEAAMAAEQDYDDGSASLIEAARDRPPSDEAMTSGSAWNQHVREQEAEMATKQTTEQVDFVVGGGGTVYTLTPLTEAAREWAAEHLFNPNDEDGEPTWFGGGIVVEHRYIGEIVTGIVNDGLTVR